MVPGFKEIDREEAEIMWELGVQLYIKSGWSDAVYGRGHEPLTYGRVLDASPLNNTLGRFSTWYVKKGSDDV